MASRVLDARRAGRCVYRFQHVGGLCQHRGDVRPVRARLSARVMHLHDASVERPFPAIDEESVWGPQI